MAFLLVANLVLFVYTAARILAVRKDTAILHKADSARTQSANETQRSVAKLLISPVISGSEAPCSDCCCPPSDRGHSPRALGDSEGEEGEDEAAGVPGLAGCLPRSCLSVGTVLAECRWVRHLCSWLCTSCTLATRPAAPRAPRAQRHAPPLLQARALREAVLPDGPHMGDGDHLVGLGRPRLVLVRDGRY